MHLLHVSQISRAHVEKPSDVLSIGQEITAKVVDLNEDEKKISLSMKALEPAAGTCQWQVFCWICAFVKNATRCS